jgi:hypothetical protein
MKPYLLFERYDGISRRKIPNENELMEDLNLHAIFQAMARGDHYLYDTVKSVVLSGLTDTNTILYRQEVLKDCIGGRNTIGRLYDIAAAAMEEAADYQQYARPNFTKMISMTVKVMNSVKLLEMLAGRLEELAGLSRPARKGMHSKGLTAFFGQLDAFLTADFFQAVRLRLSELKSISGDGKMIIGSGIGGGLKGVDHILRRIDQNPVKPDNSPKFISPKSNTGPKSKSTSKNSILLDHISLANSAKEIEEAGLVHILRLVNYFNNTIIDFFESLRYETGFYYGCTNLFSEISRVNIPVCYPSVDEADARNLVFEGLYDLSLSLCEKKKLVSNELSAMGKTLFIITGANQGGKSTYLRSIGIAQLLTQCGMFVPAVSYRANVCENIYTHFTKEEDINMNSGKLEEELLRMNEIINGVKAGSMLLLNEPFATTTERDGSNIARDIVAALYEYGVKIFFVTHLYEFANTLHGQEPEKTVFLRAERNRNGSRSYCIRPGQPLRTSFGEDLFLQVVGRLRGPELAERSSRGN